MSTGMRITIAIPSDLISRARRRASDEETTLSAIVEAALRAWLERPASAPYRLRWHPQGGSSIPRVDLDSRGDLFDRMDGLG